MFINDYNIVVIIIAYSSLVCTAQQT